MWWNYCGECVCCGGFLVVIVVVVLRFLCACNGSGLEMPPPVRAICPFRASVLVLLLLVVLLVVVVRFETFSLLTFLAVCVSFCCLRPLPTSHLPFPCRTCWILLSHTAHDADAASQPATCVPTCVRVSLCVCCVRVCVTSSVWLFVLPLLPLVKLSLKIALKKLRGKARQKAAAKWTY